MGGSILLRMGVTIEIPDALLDEARAVAEREHTTVQALVEEGLRTVLERRAEQQTPFQLRDGSVGGNGLQPGIDLTDWDAMLALIYEGRGG